MNLKKLTILRLGIYTVFSFLPIWIMALILKHFYGEVFWMNTPEKILLPVGLLTMMTPSIANLLTRCLTKEGMQHSYLGLHLRGNGGYYLAAVLVKVVEAFAEALLLALIFLKEMPLSEIFSGADVKKVIPLSLLIIISCVYICFHAFGEEFGWRGYMMPKLIELVGKPAAVLIGGIIWGLWHTPLTLAGHNFGVDYPGYPWLGILFMCVECVLMNAFLTLLTEKTKTVYPAAICHSINNGFGVMYVFQMLACETAVEKIEQISLKQLPWYLIGLEMITAAVSMLLLMKHDES